MSELEKTAVETIRDALEVMSTDDQKFLLGYAEGYRAAADAEKAKRAETCCEERSARHEHAQD